MKDFKKLKISDKETLLSEIRNREVEITIKNIKSNKLEKYVGWVDRKGPAFIELVGYCQEKKKEQTF